MAAGLFFYFLTQKIGIQDSLEQQEVVSDYEKYKGEKEAKEAGKLRSEGKEYVMQDGDVCLFRFNN